MILPTKTTQKLLTIPKQAKLECEAMHFLTYPELV